MNPAELTLVELTAAIGPADWQRFESLVVRARACGTPRTWLEEAVLQSALFFGFPRAVTAFESLADRWPRPVEGEPVTRAATWRAEGEAMFAGVYGSNSAAVRALLTSFHPEFHDFVIECAYGRILARPALEPRVRELCGVAALAVLDQVPQLVAHARGALRFGATLDDLERSLAAVLPAGEVEPLLRRISRRGDGDRPDA